MSGAEIMCVEGEICDSLEGRIDCLELDMVIDVDRHVVMERPPKEIMIVHLHYCCI